MKKGEYKVSYEPLWVYLIKNQIKKSELQERTNIAASTFTKMSKNEYVSLEVIVRICMALGCELNDVVMILR